MYEPTSKLQASASASSVWSDDLLQFCSAAKYASCNELKGTPFLAPYEDDMQFPRYIVAMGQLTALCLWDTTSE